MDVTIALAALKVVGYGLAAIGPGIGIGVATYGLCVSAARQPEMKGTLMGYFFIGTARPGPLLHRLARSCTTSCRYPISTKKRREAS